MGLLRVVLDQQQVVLVKIKLRNRQIMIDVQLSVKCLYIYPYGTYSALNSKEFWFFLLQSPSLFPSFNFFFLHLHGSNWASNFIFKNIIFFLSVVSAPLLLIYPLFIKSTQQLYIRYMLYLVIIHLACYIHVLKHDKVHVKHMQYTYENFFLLTVILYIHFQNCL